jgi:hypothetical protein
MNAELCKSCFCKPENGKRKRKEIVNFESQGESNLDPPAWQQTVLSTSLHKHAAINP